MRNWCKCHPIEFMALYLVFYLSFFFLLEKTVVPQVYVHCALDDIIPFCKYAIVPYYLWFGWIVATLLWFVFRGPAAEFWRLCLPLFAGMTIALCICAVIPNGVALRPAYVPGNDLFARLVRGLYAGDTSTNVCPSIHVFNSITLNMAYQRSTRTMRRSLRWMRPAAHLLNISIILSTMLLKQHSLVDVLCGALLAVTLDFAAAIVSVPRESLPQNVPFAQRAAARLRAAYERA